MERLTKRISTPVQNKYSLGTYLRYDFSNTDSINELLNKLGRVEDFMETFGYESLQHLEFTLEEQNKVIEAYEEENQALKDRWEKLKSWIDYCSSGCLEYDEILQKMKELEEED